MKSYMFYCELPSVFSREMEELVPRHQEFINKLFLNGTIISYSVSQLRTSLWCVLIAADEQEAMELVSHFPLHPYFLEVMCHPLMFHHTVPAVLPEISLN